MAPRSQDKYQYELRRSAQFYQLHNCSVGASVAPRSQVSVLLERCCILHLPHDDSRSHLSNSWFPRFTFLGGRFLGSLYPRIFLDPVRFLFLTTLFFLLGLVRSLFFNLERRQISIPVLPWNHLILGRDPFFRQLFNRLLQSLNRLVPFSRLYLPI